MTPEGIVRRVRERLPAEFFKFFTLKEKQFHLCLAAWKVSKETLKSLEEVCPMGDPLADCVAWAAVVGMCEHLEGVYLQFAEDLFYTPEVPSEVEFRRVQEIRTNAEEQRDALLGAG